MQQMKRLNNEEKLSLDCLKSLLFFTQIFYKERTGREFKLSQPTARESHYLTICKALKKIYNGGTKKLIINVPPRYGKSEILIHFVAWSLANNPQSNYIYVSYSHSLAKKQTQTIRDIINLPLYKSLFNIRIKDDSSAKDNFQVAQGGNIYASGAGGSITGFGAGIKNSNTFNGAIIIDDIHKPDEVESDTIREGVNEWYYNTLQSRVNSPDTPIIFLGQRLHEDDLVAHLLKTEDWESVIIPALDIHNNPLHEEMHDLKSLLKMKQESPYVFASQYQQDPQPAGGGIFQRDWFQVLEFEPKILSTFITTDTAETDKDYNDATVFSFWGLHKIFHGEVETDLYGLHWLDCIELRCEPKDLENEFMQFYHSSMRYKVKPSVVAIEKKSTGVTLLSVLKDYQGLSLRSIERTKASGSKTSRFLEAQPYIAQKLISLPLHGRHTEMCIEHCRKITANNSHRFDDIADTLYDAVKIALIDQSLIKKLETPTNYQATAKKVMGFYSKVDRLRREAYKR